MQKQINIVLKSLWLLIAAVALWKGLYESSIVFILFAIYNLLEEIKITIQEK